MGNVDLDQWNIPSIGTVNLHVARLTALKFSPSLSKGRPGSVTQGHVDFASEVIGKNTGKYGSICFVVSSAGSGLCEEEALALQNLATQVDGKLRGFRLFGIVKDFGVDNDGLSSFHLNTFRFPLYNDDDMVFFKAFVRKKQARRRSVKEVQSITDACNTISKTISSGTKKMGISKDEEFSRGGFLVIGPDAKIKYAYPEKTGTAPPIEYVAAAAAAIRAEEKVRKKQLLDVGEASKPVDYELSSLIRSDCGTNGTARNKLVQSSVIVDKRKISEERYQDDFHEKGGSHGRSKKRLDKVSAAEFAAVDDFQLTEKRDSKEKRARSKRRSSIAGGELRIGADMTALLGLENDPANDRCESPKRDWSSFKEKKEVRDEHSDKQRRRSNDRSVESRKNVAVNSESELAEARSSSGNNSEKKIEKNNTEDELADVDFEELYNRIDATEHRRRPRRRTSISGGEIRNIADQITFRGIMTDIQDFATGAKDKYAEAKSELGSLKNKYGAGQCDKSNIGRDKQLRRCSNERTLNISQHGDSGSEQESTASRRKRRGSVSGQKLEAFESDLGTVKQNRRCSNELTPVSMEHSNASGGSESQGTRSPPSISNKTLEVDESKPMERKQHRRRSNERTPESKQYSNVSGESDLRGTRPRSRGNTSNRTLEVDEFLPGEGKQRRRRSNERSPEPKGHIGDSKSQGTRRKARESISNRTLEVDDSGVGKGRRRSNERTPEAKDISGESKSQGTRPRARGNNSDRTLGVDDSNSSEGKQHERRSKEQVQEAKENTDVSPESEPRTRRARRRRSIPDRKLEVDETLLAGDEQRHLRSKEPTLEPKEHTYRSGEAEERGTKARRRRSIPDNTLVVDESILEGVKQSRRRSNERTTEAKKGTDSGGESKPHGTRSRRRGSIPDRKLEVDESVLESEKKRSSRRSKEHTPESNENHEKSAQAELRSTENKEHSFSSRGSEPALSTRPRRRRSIPDRKLDVDESMLKERMQHRRRSNERTPESESVPKEGKALRRRSNERTPEAKEPTKTSGESESHGTKSRRRGSIPDRKIEVDESILESGKERRRRSNERTPDSKHRSDRESEGSCSRRRRRASLSGGELDTSGVSNKSLGAKARCESPKSDHGSFRTKSRDGSNDETGGKKQSRRHSNERSNEDRLSDIAGIGKNIQKRRGSLSDSRLVVAGTKEKHKLDAVAGPQLHESRGDSKRSARRRSSISGGEIYRKKQDAAFRAFEYGEVEGQQLRSTGREEIKLKSDDVVRALDRPKLRKRRSISDSEIDQENLHDSETPITSPIERARSEVKEKKGDPFRTSSAVSEIHNRHRARRANRSLEAEVKTKNDIESETSGKRLAFENFPKTDRHRTYQMQKEPGARRRSSISAHARSNDAEPCSLEIHGAGASYQLMMSQMRAKQTARNEGATGRRAVRRASIGGYGPGCQTSIEELKKFATMV